MYAFRKSNHRYTRLLLSDNTCEILKRLVICLDYNRDAVEHFSVTLDSSHDRGAFQLRNAPLALNVEEDSSEVA